MAKSKKIDRLENLDLKPDEIEKLLDGATVTDEIFDFIATKYKDKIESNDESYRRIRNLINLVDITKLDEDALTVSLSEAAKRSFFNFMKCGKISRPEIIYYVKKDLVNENDIFRLFKEKYVNKEFIDILLNWRPQLFESLLKNFCAEYNITQSMLDNAKSNKCLEKFNFMLE